LSSSAIQVSPASIDRLIDGQDGTEIAERAKALRGALPTATAIDQPARDLLSDVGEVMREETRVRTEVIRQRLAELDARVYEGITAQELTEAVTAVGVRPYKSDGLMTVRLADVRRAITQREALGLE
jgi:S-DNA-T family DNA segregation ATPase FtsK/SpoIIIE